MWIERPIAGICVGEDKRLEFELYDLGPVSLDDYPTGYLTPDELDALIATGEVTPVNVTGWTFTFILRKGDKSVDPALLTKAATIEGTYNADPAVNTQIVVVALADTDTAAADGTSVTLAPKVYRYSLKRTDSGAETIYARGDFDLQEATAR
jgi:hypothetical protein